MIIVSADQRIIKKPLFRRLVAHAPKQNIVALRRF